ncbi:MAG: hypothetical protein JWP78_3108 [Mucilaginibacter sp.]|nr:hypothetical protein [Mucilaginibacter sp.]
MHFTRLIPRYLHCLLDVDNMSIILHILNGDSTARSFEQTGLDGDILVWREILSQGPVQEDISSGAFWSERSRWIGKAFNDTAEHYQQQVVNALEKLSEPYGEINLWFEFDLHCQANLLGVINMLLKKTDLSMPAVYLICPGEFPGKEVFRGMGELNGGELEYLYDNIRVQLGEPDFAIAEQAWKLYVSGKADELEEWLNENTFWGGLTLLKPALQAHLERTRTNENGLNAIEQKLLDIYNSGIKNKRAIYQAFWQTGKIYGMGDLEIDIYLRSLAGRQLINL